MAGTPAQNEWLHRVIGVSTAAPISTSRVDAGSDGLMLDERLGDAKVQLSLLVKAGNPEVRRLGAALLDATRLVAARSPDAAAAVDRLETALATAMKTGRQRVDAGSDGLMLDERLGDAKVQLSLLVKAGNPEVRQLGAALLDATGLVAARSPDAAAAVDRLETALATAMKTGRQREAPGGSKVSIALRKLLIEWHAAQKTAEENIVLLGKAYLADEEVRADPRFDLVQEVVSELPTIIPQFGDELDDDINAILNDGGKTPAVVNKGIERVKTYRARLQGAAELAAVESVASKDLGGDFKVVATLSNAIERISMSLAEIVT